MREKLFKYIRKIAKIEAGCIAPTWLRVIRYILFPIKSYLYENSDFGYDLASHTITINGIRMSIKMLENIGRISEKEQIRLVKENGEIIWRREHKWVLKDPPFTGRLNLNQRY